jgi:hypothetical protein
MAQKSGTHSSARSVYFIPKTMRNLMKSDSDERLKIVTSGIKVLERKGKGGPEDYRLVQEGLKVIVPHITSRKYSVSCQDFCNILGGGLVSLSTFHADTIKLLSGIPSGAMICVYKYDPEDIIVEDAEAEGMESEVKVSKVGKVAEKVSSNEEVP